MQIKIDFIFIIFFLQLLKIYNIIHFIHISPTREEKDTFHEFEMDGENFQIS